MIWLCCMFIMWMTSGIYGSDQFIISIDTFIRKTRYANIWTTTLKLVFTKFYEIKSVSKVKLFVWNIPLRSCQTKKKSKNMHFQNEKKSQNINLIRNIWCAPMTLWESIYNHTLKKFHVKLSRFRIECIYYSFSCTIWLYQLYTSKKIRMRKQLINKIEDFEEFSSSGYGSFGMPSLQIVFFNLLFAYAKNEVFHGRF